MAIRFGVTLVIVAVLIGLTSVFVGGDDDNESDASSTTVAAADLPDGCTDAVPEANPARPTSFPAAPPMSIDPAKTYTALLKTSCGDITIALDAANAPDQRQQLRVPRAAEVLRRIAVAASGAGLRHPDRRAPTTPRSGGPGYSIVPKCRPQPATRSARWRGPRPGRNPRARPARSSSSSPGSGGASLPDDYGTIGTVTAGIENAQKIDVARAAR